MDFANAPWITPWPACTRNWTPTSVAYARLEKTENIVLKNPPKDPSTRCSRGLPTRSPSATRVASATAAHAFVVVSGPRQIASNTMPESSVSAIDIPGMSPMRLGVSSSSNQFDAIRPGNTTRKNSPNNTRTVCRGSPSGPGWSSRCAFSAAAASFAAWMLAGDGVYNPSPVITLTSGPIETPEASAAWTSTPPLLNCPTRITSGSPPNLRACACTSSK